MNEKFFLWKKKSIIAIGNPVIDISAKVPMSLIEKYKIPFGQACYLDKDNLPFFEELEKQPDVSYVPGGSIENSLRIASYALDITHNKEFKCTMLGCVGNDKYKDKLEESLKSIGITPMFEVNDKEPTSSCAVGICDKERSIISNIKASGLLSEDFVNKHFKEICSHEALLVEGYFLMEKYDLCKKIIRHFRENNKPVILTLSSVVVIEKLGDKLVEIASMSDLIFCNRKEAAAFGQSEEKDIEALSEKIHRKLKTLVGRTLIITCGENGVMISKFDYQANQMEFVLHAFAIKLPLEKIVDFNGAGDAFCGAFVSEYMKNMPYTYCAKAGNTASSIILQRTGCTFDKDVKFEYYV